MAASSICNDPVLIVALKAALGISPLPPGPVSAIETINSKTSDGLGNFVLEAGTNIIIGDGSVLNSVSISTPTQVHVVSCLNQSQNFYLSSTIPIYSSLALSPPKGLTIITITYNIIGTNAGLSEHYLNFFLGAVLTETKTMNINATHAQQLTATFSAIDIPALTIISFSADSGTADVIGSFVANNVFVTIITYSSY